MTKTRFRYEKPVLVGLNGENVVAALCNPYGSGYYSGGCQEGSCVVNVLCSTGNRTQACLAGPDACEKSSICYATCSTGASVVVPKKDYYCVNGDAASHTCEYGSSASMSCVPTGGYVGLCY